MPKPARTCNQLLIIFLLVPMIIVIVSAHAGSDTLLARLVVTSPPQKLVPEASIPCSLEESRWWQEVRASAKDAAVAAARKLKALREANNRFINKHGFMPDDEKDLFSQKDLAELNEALTVSKEKYLALLRDGAEESYRPPIPDGSLLLLQPTPPPDILSKLGEITLRGQWPSAPSLFRMGQSEG